MATVTMIEENTKDAEVREAGGADAEVEAAVVGVAVEPEAVVGVAVGRGRDRHRSWCLVDEVVVERAEHGGTFGRVAPMVNHGRSGWRTGCGGRLAVGQVGDTPPSRWMVCAVIHDDSSAAR